MKEVKILLEKLEDNCYVATARDDLGDVCTIKPTTRKQAIDRAKKKAKEILETDMTFVVEDMY